MSGRFAYRAHGRDGRVVSGSIAAASSEEAFWALRARAVHPFELRPAAPAMLPGSRLLARRHRGPSPDERAELLDGLATLLEARLGVEAALGLLAGEARGPGTRAMLTTMRERVVNGTALSDSMAEHPGSFTPPMVAAAQAGELAGDLARVIRDLAATTERQLALRRSVVGALAYPAFLIAAALGVVGVILAVLIPAVEPLFEGSGVAPPLTLVVLGSVAAGLGQPAAWAGLATVAALLAWLAGTPRLATRREALLLRLPLLGAFLREAELARFAATLALLLRGGAAVDRAIAVAAGTLRAQRFRHDAQALLAAVTAGEPVATALRRTALARGQALHVLKIAEESGALANGFAQLARLGEARLQRNAARLLRLLAPTLTLLVGGVIGLVVVTIMDAVLQLNEVAFQ